MQYSVLRRTDRVEATAQRIHVDEEIYFVSYCYIGLYQLTVWRHEQMTYVHTKHTSSHHGQLVVPIFVMNYGKID